jgi:hypothetical protein
LPLSEATVGEVRTAQRELARRSRRSRTRPSPVEEALARALGAVRALDGISVAVRAGRLRLGEIPVTAIGALARHSRPRGAGGAAQRRALRVDDQPGQRLHAVGGVVRPA